MAESSLTRPRSRFWGRVRLLLLFVGVAALLALARPTPSGVIAGALFAAAGASLHFWSAGHLTKTAELVTSGPYRYTRNPLYLGRLLIFTGLALAARLPYQAHLVVLAVGYLVFFGYYLPRKERVEPARLRREHGAAYGRYFDAVPTLFPALRPYPETGGRRWAAARMLRNREHWMLVALLAIWGWLAVRAAGLA